MPDGQREVSRYGSAVSSDAQVPCAALGVSALGSHGGYSVNRRFGNGPLLNAVRRHRKVRSFPSCRFGRNVTRLALGERRSGSAGNSTVRERVRRELEERASSAVVDVSGIALVLAGIDLRRGGIRGFETRSRGGRGKGIRGSASEIFGVRGKIQTRSRNGGSRIVGGSLNVGRGVSRSVAKTYVHVFRAVSCRQGMGNGSRAGRPVRGGRTISDGELDLRKRGDRVRRTSDRDANGLGSGICRQRERSSGRSIHVGTTGTVVRISRLAGVPDFGFGIDVLERSPDAFEHVPVQGDPMGNGNFDFNGRGFFLGSLRNGIRMSVDDTGLIETDARYDRLAFPSDAGNVFDDAGWSVAERGAVVSDQLRGHVAARRSFFHGQREASRSVGKNGLPANRDRRSRTVGEFALDEVGREGVSSRIANRFGK